MIMRNQRDFSAPHQKVVREAYEENRRSKVMNPVSSQAKELVLRFDINTLLALFNELESNGQISRKALRKILERLGIQAQESKTKAESYTFDHFLSILGEIQVPSEPSIYVLSFVKVLSNYRNKCLKSQEQGLYEAKEVQQRIRRISQGEIQRQKLRIKMEHSKIYQEMQVSQEKQFLSFQEEWKTYLKEFKEETARRLQETKYSKKTKIIEQQNKFLTKARKNNILTSPRLRELLQRKKWLIQEKKYDQAIDINLQISKQKEKLTGYKQEATDNILSKKLEKLTNSNNRYIGAIEKNLQVNLNRLISKKKEGENIMKIRMKNLREEANRKLSQHYRTEVNRLRNSFYIAANH